jgi:hypothetical protein
MHPDYLIADASMLLPVAWLFVLLHQNVPNIAWTTDRLVVLEGQQLLRGVTSSR